MSVSARLVLWAAARMTYWVPREMLLSFWLVMALLNLLFEGGLYENQGGEVAMEPLSIDVIADTDSTYVLHCGSDAGAGDAGVEAGAGHGCHCCHTGGPGGLHNPTPPLNAQTLAIRALTNGTATITVTLGPASGR